MDRVCHRNSHCAREIEGAMEEALEILKHDHSLKFEIME
jgi:hypothetical protein